MRWCSQAYDQARKMMTTTAEQTKRCYDQKANATPLLTGERVWVRNRNRQGQGKLHGGRGPRTTHCTRNSGRLRTGVQGEARVGGEGRKSCTGILLNCVQVPCHNHNPQPHSWLDRDMQSCLCCIVFLPSTSLQTSMRDLRRSSRSNRGVPQERYRL